jgi:hypothetical protein
MGMVYLLPRGDAKVSDACLAIGGDVLDATSIVWR